MGDRMQVKVPVGLIDHNPWQTREIDVAHARELAFNPARGIAAVGLDQVPKGRLVDERGHLVPLQKANKQAQQEGMALTFVFHGGAADREDSLTYFGWRVQLAFGHHRLEAFRLIWKEGGIGPDENGRSFELMPVVLEDLTDEQMAVRAWSENEDRVDLTPLEEARALQAMVLAFNWSQAEVAEHVGLSRSTVATKLRLLRADEGTLRLLGEGKISERAAQAMVALNQLPVPARKRLEKGRVPAWVSAPAKILTQVEEQGRDSDWVRNRVESAIDAVCKPLDENSVPWPLDHDFSDLGEDGVLEIDLDLVQHGRCTDCDVKLQRGSEMRCADADCWEQKQYLWDTRQLAKAIEVTGLRAQTPEEKEGRWGAREAFYGQQRAGSQLAEILEVGCERGNLRLAVGDSMQKDSLPGVPAGVRVVCQHGQGKHCYCLANLKRQETKAENEERAAREKQVREEVVAPARAALREALANGDRGAWLMVLQAVTDKDWPVDMDLAMIHGELSASLVRRWVAMGWGESDVDRAKEAVRRQLLDADMELPWEESPAYDIERRLRRIRRFLKDEFVVDGVQFGNLQPEVLRGNLANLGELQVEVEELDGEIPEEEQRRLLATIEDEIDTVTRWLAEPPLQREAEAGG